MGASAILRESKIPIDSFITFEKQTVREGEELPFHIDHSNPSDKPLSDVTWVGTFHPDSSRLVRNPFRLLRGIQGSSSDAHANLDGKVSPDRDDHPHDHQAS
jgi:hypothetical protein